jgi:hypothetical protein
MNGYLNNLTLRTLNAGNRVEPRLPALFEPAVFESAPGIDDETESYEKEISVLSAVAPAPVGAEQTVSVQKLSAGPLAAKPDDRPFGRKLKSVDESVEEPESFSTRVDPVPQRDTEPTSFDTVESLPVSVSLAPPTELEKESVVEASSPALEYGGLAPLSPGPSLIDTEAALGRRTPKRRPERSGAVVSKPPVERDHFREEISSVKTETSTQTQARETRSVARPNEAPRIVEDFETEEDSQPADLQTPSYARPNPTQHPWRDAREQTRASRRRHSFAPIEPEPTINVTIGRVEVRAVPANNDKSTSRRPSESPVMPLEDYLRKQRRGGEG